MSTTSSFGLPTVSVNTALVSGRIALRSAVVIGGIDELHRDAKLRQRVVEQVVGAAVQRRGGDDFVARRRECR